MNQDQKIKPTKVFIIGFYGCHNTGDEAILTGILESLKETDHPFKVRALSYNPKHTKKVHGIKGIKQSLHKGILKTLLWEWFGILKAIFWADVVLLGGGSLIHDLRFYNLPILLGACVFAKIIGKKAVLYGCGVGPITTKFGKWCCRHLLGRFDLITVRDERGVEWLKSAGVRKEVVQTVDPAFAWIGKKPLFSPDQLLDKEGIPKDRGLIGITVSGWFKSANFWQKDKMNFSKEVRDMLQIMNETIKRYDKDLIFLTTVFPADKGMALRLKRKCDFPERVWVMKNEYDPVSTANLFKKIDFLIGMRLHSLIFAVMMEIPFCAMIYDQKVANFLKMSGMSGYSVSLEDLDLNQFSRVIAKTVRDKDMVRKQLHQVAADLQKVALKNGELVKELVK